MVESLLNRVEKIQNFLPVKNLLLLDTGEVFSANHTEIYVLFKGGVEMINDSGTLAYINAPYIIGLRGLSYGSGEFEHKAYYLRASSSSAISRYTMDEFVEIIDSNALWRDVAHIISASLNYQLLVSGIITSKDAYQVIRQMLLYIMEHQDVYYKKNTSLVIMQKTGLSKSTVMNILTMLKKNKCIEIHRGVLQVIYILPDSL